MKLRNRKTGEIVEFRYLQSDYVAPLVLTTYENDKPEMYTYNSLAELNEEWEDYEEDKKYWFIDEEGEIKSKELGYFNLAQDSIGNRFKTKEEAEKAVEKLKAWKRLKDKGLTFCGWNITDDGCSVDVETTLDAEIVRAQQKYITDDLNLLFGGEE